MATRGWEGRAGGDVGRRRETQAEVQNGSRRRTEAERLSLCTFEWVAEVSTQGMVRHGARRRARYHSNSLERTLRYLRGTKAREERNVPLAFGEQVVFATDRNDAVL
jgi:hypothetical protein